MAETTGTHLYLSLIPESLVASMLPPEAFGTYLTVGTRKRSRGEAVYFELADDFRSDSFDLSRVPRECVAHADGQPKHSVYLGIYRVLEHVPLSAIGDLYLATRDGRVLQLAQAELPPSSPGDCHLYDEICPVHPLVASPLDPVDFCRFITDPSSPIWVPRICFSEIKAPKFYEEDKPPLVLGQSALYWQHVRDCIDDLLDGGKRTKTVDRNRCVLGPAGQLRGIYVGDQEGTLYYPFPSPEELEEKHHGWWRSATV